MALRELSFGLSRGPKPLLLPPLMQASTQNGLHIRFAPHGSDAKDIKFKLPRGLTKKMTLLMLFGREPQANRPMKAELMTTNRAGLSIGVEVFHNGEAAVRYRGLNGVAQRTKRVDVDKDGGFYVIVIDVDDNTEIQVKVNGVDLLQSRMLYDTKGLDILSIFLIKWKMYELHLISESAPVYPDKFTHSHYPRLALGAFLELSGTVAVLGNQDKLQFLHNGRPFGAIAVDSSWLGKVVVISIRFHVSHMTVDSSLAGHTVITNMPQLQPTLTETGGEFAVSPKFVPYNAVLVPGFWGDFPTFTA
ncbi:uncharacterized protein [Dermacentor andersoni]|uniref:uncharacterized protein n=1 Tax=Dermacentor andersoni TaxID=34620 RepID=UPI00241633DC|nr:uncharacterized protein LOC129383671 isoform X3 [Dermacentor andersoni]